MDLSTYIGSVTLKEGRAIECVMLLFSSTTLGTCTRYGYVVKKSKGKYIVGTGLEGGGYWRDGAIAGRHREYWLQIKRTDNKETFRFTIDTP